MTNLKVGDKAPDFSLQSNTGDQFKLSELRGKNVVLFFYPMDESPVCSREVEAFKEKNPEFRGLNAEIVGVSSQNVESHRSFASKHSSPFLLLSDPKGIVRKLYGVSSTLGIPGRVTFVVNKDGVIVFVYSSQMHPARHAQEALAALKNV
ncbi:MAG TPA: peroxiredoxin [Candidatus Sulfotelmatobacter sp.]|nr:peroxiredoxin [Candidatus Sulfotelmatobacter sp.]